MTQMNAGARRDNATPPSAPHATGADTLLEAEVPERPALAPNVELVGLMPETGFTKQQWLMQRDGKFLQVTELLYRVAEQINGERTLEEIAEGVTDSTEWLVSADHIRQLIQTKLIPQGLIATTDGDAANAGGRATASPLSVNFRTRVIGPNVIDPIAKVLQVLYVPALMVPLLLSIAAAHAWLYLSHGVAGSFRDVLSRPWALLAVIGLMILAGVFHEFGHAAALRYGGGKVRGMGVGLYLIYPAFYTDVTDTYRLGRWARVRTDLGGFYFYLIFTLGIIALYFATGLEFLLLVVVLIGVDILYQCLPFVRFDGYWALADLTGIPDFFSQMGPFLVSILAGPGYKGDRLPNLKPWVKAVFIAYIVLVIPVLAFLYLLLIQRLPVFLRTTWDSLLSHARLLRIAWENDAIAAIPIVVLNMLLLTVFVLGSLYIFYSAMRRMVRGIWGWMQPTARRQVIGSLAIGALLGLVAFFWVPQVVAMAAAVRPEMPAGVQSFGVTENQHVQTPIVYAQNPPVGGDHAPVWQNCGFYSAPIASENAVHSMEHGAVWITYRPDLPQEQIDVLRRRANSQTYLLVSPYPNLPAPVVTSAWDRQLQLESADDPRLDQFVRVFRLGEQAPEAGESCTGGIGVPQ